MTWGMKLAALALCIGLSGCATAPVQREVENSALVPASQEVVWERLLIYFTSNNIQIKTIEKASGVIYAESGRFSAEFADCGEDPLSYTASSIAGLNVFVRAEGAATRVNVNTTFSIVRAYERTSWKVECYSTGLLEAGILKAVGAP